MRHKAEGDLVLVIFIWKNPHSPNTNFTVW